MIKIAIVDDHPIVLHGLEKIISRQTDMSLVGKARNASECMELVKKVECDVLVLDVSLPDRNGFEALEELKKTHPGIKVLILTMYSESKFAIRAFESGASGYINKETVADELITAIRVVSSGKKYITPAVAQELAQYIDKDHREKPPHEALSKREYRVMVMLSSGMLLKEIAAELGISLKTVATYKDRIKNKMHIKTNAELIRYVVNNKLT
jgi:DNA-binding NarL/FixJ family response regulator